MKNIKLLSVLCILSLSACQKGRIASESGTSLAQTSSAPLVGTLLDVDMNPVPSGPSASATPVSTLRIADPSNVDSVATVSAPLPDKYEIFYGTQLSSQLSGLSEYQGAYQSYLASLAAAPSTAIPSSLLASVSFSLKTYNGKTAAVSMRVIDVLKAGAAVITYGTSAWAGAALMPATGSATGVALSSLTSVKFVKYGTGLFAIGGIVTGSLNRNVASISFTSNGAFNVSANALATLTQPDCHISTITSAAVLASLKTAVTSVNSTVGSSLIANTTVFIGYSTSAGVINSIYKYDLPSGSPTLVAAVGNATFAGICSAVVGSFSGNFTCATAVPAIACPAIASPAATSSL